MTAEEARERVGDILRVRACASGRVELSAPGGGRDERA